MELITKHFPSISEKQLLQFESLGPLYSDWNSKINVISRKDIENLYSHHILHSLTIAKYIQFNPDEVILDAGTGGGFPGLPLAIMFPNTQFVLADSINKKLTVIDAIAKDIGLQNITTQHIRVEELTGSYDYVVSRAVTRLNEMWNWVEKSIRINPDSAVANGLIYLKGGDISSEIPNNCSIQQIPLTNLINEPQFVDKALIHLYKK
jgi:16S rRNA (guanine527-N7)-methyltransferase